MSEVASIEVREKPRTSRAVLLTSTRTAGSMANHGRPTSLRRRHVARSPPARRPSFRNGLRFRSAGAEPECVRRHADPELDLPDRPGVVQLPGGLALSVVADDAVPVTGQLRAAGPLPVARPAHDRCRRPAGRRRLVVHHPALLAGELSRRRIMGNWGREVNFHNVAGDAGPTGGHRLGLRQRRLVARPRLASRRQPRRSSPSSRTHRTRTFRCRRSEPRHAGTRTSSISSPGAPTGARCTRAPLTVWADGSEHAAISPQQHQHRSAGEGPRRQLVRPALDAALGGRLHRRLSGESRPCDSP